MYKLALICVSFVGLIAGPASAAGAGDARWTVTQLSGDARIVHPGLQPASVHVRSELMPGDTIVGPAVIEQLDSTTLLFPGDSGTVDSYLNLVVEMSA